MSLLSPWFFGSLLVIRYMPVPGVSSEIPVLPQNTPVRPAIKSTVFRLEDEFPVTPVDSSTPAVRFFGYAPETDGSLPPVSCASPLTFTICGQTVNRTRCPDKIFCYLAYFLPRVFSSPRIPSPNTLPASPTGKTCIHHKKSHTISCRSLPRYISDNFLFLSRSETENLFFLSPYLPA